MSKLAVKYLDPETGEYKYATVVDVGDLTKLKTTVKSDLVSAINSIEITGELPADVQNQLDEINQNINDIQSGVLTEAQVVGINQKITEGISSLVIEVGELNVKINDDIVKAKNELLGDMDQKLENVENDYNSKIGVISGSLDGAKADIDSVESDLINVGTKLQTVETNYTKVSSDIDTINGELSTKVNSSDFNLMESKVSKNTTEINQTKEDISLLATKSSLDLVTDRVTKAESDIQINADGLSSRVTYTELNKQLDNASKYGDNILRGTRNWDNWKTNNIAKAYISNDTYRHCKIQVIEDKQYYYETELDSLEIGKTYIASIYFKTKVESDYASVNINIGSESIPLDNLVEDTLILNGWKRVSANFVASDVKTKVSFRFSFLDTNNIGYLVASKIETGIKPSEWKPHFDDDNESIIKNETLIKQNSDSIVSLVSSTEKLGEDVETANTQITQTAESLSLQAQKITDIEGEVSENNASIVLANNKIETKVSQTDVDKSISDISLDTKNRIINSDFSRGFSNWNEINSGFTIKKISGVNYAHIDRSGLINVSIASMASDKFPAKNGDKLVFSLDFMTESISSLDDKTIMTIELFNINDTRVFSKTFNLGDFNVSIVDNVITRISSKYIVDREDVAKARVKIQLNKNGSVNFSKISLQKGDLKEKEWLLAPEDIQLLNVDLQTSIEQNADNIELKATKTDLDTTNNAVKENKASIEVANNAISQKVSSTDVEGILSEKSYATKSELTQTSNSLTSTITGLQTDVDGKADKTELSQLSQNLSGFKTTVANTYADKVSVASQINQSATAVTSNVQSWTNNKLTAYSTTQQTATSITNAVASKADKTQITQLSDSINLKVSKGDVVSQINVEAGQILFNSNKLVLNANTTEIAGDAFIRGDMIVDGTIKGKQLDVDKISSIANDLGEINAGSYSSWDIDDYDTPEGFDTLYRMTGIFMDRGRSRYLTVVTSILDPYTPMVNTSSIVRIEGSMQTGIGYRGIKLLSAELTTDYIGKTLDDILKTNILFIEDSDEMQLYDVETRIFHNDVGEKSGLILGADQINIRGLHNSNVTNIDIYGNIDTYGTNGVSANGRSLSRRASVTKGIYYTLSWTFRRIGDIVYVDVPRQRVTLAKSAEEDLATEGIPIGFRPAYNHPFSLSSNVGSTVGADVIINMLGDNSGNMRVTNTTTNAKMVQGSTSYITNNPFPS